MKYSTLQTIRTFTSSLCLSLGLFAVALVQSAAPITEANHDAPIYYSAQSFVEAMGEPFVDVVFEEGLRLEDEFELICWNIEKGSNPGWKAELRSLAKNTQVVLLQEAVFVEEMKNPRDESLFWSFSPGYKTKKYNSGVMTVSRMKPSVVCALESTEPWLRSPKKTSVVQFPLETEGESLLLVNIHAINFTVGVRAFSAQLDEVGHILRHHNGPIIFSGDLNTWTNARNSVLSPFVEEFGLEEIAFEPDNRSRKFGHAVDYVFIRGLSVKSARVPEVETSDHNPLIVTLAL